MKKLALILVCCLISFNCLSGSPAENDKRNDEYIESIDNWRSIQRFENTVQLLLKFKDGDYIYFNIPISTVRYRISKEPSIGMILWLSKDSNVYNGGIDPQLFIKAISVIYLRLTEKQLNSYIHNGYVSNDLPEAPKVIKKPQVSILPLTLPTSSTFENTIWGMKL